ncbi:hypothetical protein EV356DRAFT_510164 [Viridothelium virens]|uniref:Uncharacterized protein n=1 Tax=Viridothelium virens TaxID=1048519 RepID=A0A6A6GVQ5_VIRVR|nr:hypothetical protein EV356DRAFT_510164 [Viridothelium virens]
MITERAPAPTAAPSLAKRVPGVGEDQSPNLEKRGFWFNHNPFFNWDCSIYTELTTTDYYGEKTVSSLPPGSTSCRCHGDTRMPIATATRGECTTIKCAGGQTPEISFQGPVTCTPTPDGPLEKLYWKILGVDYKNVTTTAGASKRSAFPQETGSPSFSTDNDNDDIGGGVLGEPGAMQQGPGAGSGSPDSDGDGDGVNDSSLSGANAWLSSVFNPSSSASAVRHDASNTSPSGSSSASSTSYSTSTVGASSSSSSASSSLTSSSGTMRTPPTTGMPPPAATSSQSPASAEAPVLEMRAQGVVVGVLAGVAAMLMM